MAYVPLPVRRPRIRTRDMRLGGLPRRDPPSRVFEANLGGIENPDFEDNGEPWIASLPPWWRFRARRRWRNQAPVGFR